MNDVTKIVIETALAEALEAAEGTNTVLVNDNAQWKIKNTKQLTQIKNQKRLINNQDKRIAELLAKKPIVKKHCPADGVLIARVKELEAEIVRLKYETDPVSCSMTEFATSMGLQYLAFIAQLRHVNILTLDNKPYWNQKQFFTPANGGYHISKKGIKKFTRMVNNNEKGLGKLPKV